jgi:hypothetical protein
MGHGRIAGVVGAALVLGAVALPASGAAAPASKREVGELRAQVATLKHQVALLLARRPPEAQTQAAEVAAPVPGPAGPPGPAGTFAASFSGAYAGGAAAGSLVTSGGSTWLCRAAAGCASAPTVVDPAWSLVAAAGSSSALAAPATLASSEGADAAGRLLTLRADNALFPTAALHVDYAGTGNAAEIVNSSTDPSSEALSVVSNNPQDTTLGVSGHETGRGTIKVTHTGTGGDVNAAAISVNLVGPGTAAQGIFMNAPDPGTTGKLLNLRNAGVEKLVLDATGNLTAAGRVSAAGGLAVGNSVPASTLGAVVRRVPLYDQGGALLGYLPVYAGIS